MFGISFSELFVVCIVALLLIRPKDFPAIMKIIRIAHKNFTKIKKEFLVYYKQFHQELAIEANEECNYILDNNGVLQQAHDISEFKRKKSRAKKVAKRKIQ